MLPSQSEVAMIQVFLKMGQPRPLLVYYNFCGIWTGIVRVQGRHFDHCRIDDIVRSEAVRS